MIICNICLGDLNDPLQCKSFCPLCIAQLPSTGTQQPKYPTCRSARHRFEPNRALHEVLRGVGRCLNDDCEWTGRNIELATHLDECEFRSGHCVIGCQWHGPPNRMEVHLQNQHADEFEDVGATGETAIVCQTQQVGGMYWRRAFKWQLTWSVRITSNIAAV